MISEVLIGFLVTSSITFCLALMKHVYKFKFSSITFGCIKLERDIAQEINIDQLRISTNYASPRTEDNNHTSTRNNLKV